MGRDTNALLKTFERLADKDIKLKMGAATAEQRALIGFMLKHDVERVDSFWFCGGESWEARDYRTVLLAVHEGGGRRLCVAAEWKADTAQALAKTLSDFCEPPENIADLCESAGRSPPRRKVR